MDGPSVAAEHDDKQTERPGGRSGDNGRLLGQLYTRDQHTEQKDLEHAHGMIARQAQRRDEGGRSTSQ